MAGQDVKVSNQQAPHCQQMWEDVSQEARALCFQPSTGPCSEYLPIKCLTNKNGE